MTLPIGWNGNIGAALPFGMGTGVTAAASAAYPLRQWSHVEESSHPLPVHMTIRGGTSSKEEESPSSSKPSSSKRTPPKRRKRGKKSASSSDSIPSSSSSSTKKQSSTSTTTLPIVDEILRTDDYYTILGCTREKVRESADPTKLIQKSYRKRAVQTHPDKTNGDRRAFDKVSQAYEVLQDESTRKVYDRYGKKGVEQQQQQGGMGGGAAAQDMFRQFFGGNPFGNMHQQQQQQQFQQRYQMEVTLQDMYNGSMSNVQLPTGETVSVEIPRGAKDRQAIQSDDNVIFILAQRPHPTLVRRGHDLVCPVEITLTQALTGVRHTLRHLDGTDLHLVSAAGTPASTPSTSSNDSHPRPIQTGDVQILKGKGMPVRGGSGYGDLYIQYTVKPATKTLGGKGRLTASERTELKRLLSKLEGKTSDAKEWPYGDDPKAILLKEADARNFGRQQQQQQQQQSSTFDAGFSPFGGANGGQRFSWSSAASSNPFFGSAGDPDERMFGDDNGDTQCRQM